MKKIKFNSILCFIMLFPLIYGCNKKEDEVPLDEEETAYNKEMYPAGIRTSIDTKSSLAFSYQISGLSDDDEIKFVVGNSLFKTNWVEAPASTEGLDGLGPLFNARSCSSCHSLDGRGAPPNDEGVSTGLLFRFSIGQNADGSEIPEPNYGGQLQPFSIQKVDEEATMQTTYTPVMGSYPDGTEYVLRKPLHEAISPKYGALHADVMISPRIGQQMIGLGLLETISESDLLIYEDVNDRDNDGISGKANRVWNIEANKKTIGRFGWKANQPTIRQQVAGAFAGDLGITSSIFPNDDCTSTQDDCNNSINGGTPELIDKKLDQVAVYSSTIAVPIRRGLELEGKALFNQIGCNKCHVAEYTTGTHPTIPALSDITIFPYTDLLLHDMGDGLADNRPDFDADGKEWRTAPLWGVGLIPLVSGHEYLLHDGRARGVEEAILWHGGEAEKSKDAFMNLSKEERQEVINFVKSL